MSFQTQSAKVILKPGEILKPEKLREAIKKADFSAGDIRVKASGEVAANPVQETAALADLIFKIPESGQIFLLVSPPPVTSSKQKAPIEKADLLPKLREAFRSGKKKFTITGTVHEHKEFPPGLAVEEFE